MRLKISGIVNDSIVDGPGLRLAVFAQGCLHNCPGCHNPQTHDPSGGYYINIDEIIDKARKNPLLSGITLSGGEPFMQVEAMSELAKKARVAGLNVIVYTGYTWEELVTNEGFMPLVNAADYIVDGRFEIDKRTLVIPFVGSENQRIVDVKRSFETGEVVICEL